MFFLLIFYWRTPASQNFTTTRRISIFQSAFLLVFQLGGKSLSLLEALPEEAHQ
jgi:hypothetical protein